MEDILCSQASSIYYKESETGVLGGAQKLLIVDESEMLNWPDFLDVASKLKAYAETNRLNVLWFRPMSSAEMQIYDFENELSSILCIDVL